MVIIIYSPRLLVGARGLYKTFPANSALGQKHNFVPYFTNPEAASLYLIISLDT